MSEFDYDDYANDLGLDEEDRKEAKSGNDIEWYKAAEKGRTDRAALVYFHTVDVAAVSAARKKNPNISKEEVQKVAAAALASRAEKLGKTPDQLSKIDKLDLSKAQFKRFSAYYPENLQMGYILSRLGKDGPEADEVWKRLGEPKQYFTTLLLQYPTDRQGNLDKERLLTHWSLKPWRFSPKRYEAIWKVNNTLGQNGLSIASQDLSLECKDPKFQQIDVSGVGPAIWLKNEKFKEMVLTKAISLYEKLCPFREVSTDQLKAKLGMGGGSAVQDVSAADFQDLIDNV